VKRNIGLSSEERPELWSCIGLCPGKEAVKRIQRRLNSQPFLEQASLPRKGHLRSGRASLSPRIEPASLLKSHPTQKGPASLGMVLARDHKDVMLRNKDNQGCTDRDRFFPEVTQFPDFTGGSSCPAMRPQQGRRNQESDSRTRTQTPGGGIFHEGTPWR
jgi:hypothetical protein